MRLEYRPSTATLGFIPEGPPGIAATLKIMSRLVKEGKKSMQVRDKVIALIRQAGIMPKDWIVFKVAADGTVTGKAFNTTSDHHAKHDFVPVDSQEVLRKVSSMPISKWRFNGDGDVAHVGPMAQDFYAAFGLGQDDKHIATVDEEGVALAAIQGLNQKLEERDGEIKDLKRDLAEMKALLKQVLKQSDFKADR